MLLYVLAGDPLAPWGQASAIILALYMFVYILIGLAVSAALMFGSRSGRCSKKRLPPGDWLPARNSGPTPRFARARKVTTRLIGKSISRCSIIVSPPG